VRVGAKLGKAKNERFSPCADMSSFLLKWEYRTDILLLYSKLVKL
jgi:hypothetical protein